MGFWDDLSGAASAVTNPIKKVGQAVGSKDLENFGKVIGQGDPMNTITNPKDPTGFNKFIDPPAGAPGLVPGIDPNLAEIKKEQEVNAKDFRSGMPGFEQGIFKQAQKQQHNTLANQLLEIRRDAARRGIMNSGIRLNNEAGAQANSASNLAQTRMDIHKQSSAMANQLDQDAINAGITQQRLQSDIYDSIYNQALQNMVQRNQGLTSLGQGVGSVAGTAAAKK